MARMAVKVVSINNRGLPRGANSAVARAGNKLLALSEDPVDETAAQIASGLATLSTTGKKDPEHFSSRWFL